jgi:hypothetical protein
VPVRSEAAGTCRRSSKRTNPTVLTWSFLTWQRGSTLSSPRSRSPAGASPYLGDRAVKKELRGVLKQFAQAVKLRSEIIDLTTALSERPSPSETIINRIAALANRIDSAHPSASRDQLTVETKAVASKGLSGTYQRIYSHAIAIMMLTDDEAVADRGRRITKAAGSPRPK